MKVYLVMAWAFAALSTAASAAAQTLLPAASGTIRNMPELGVFELAPVGESVQSSYSRTTDMNREFRRGIVEFSIPSATILSARLVLVENRGTVSAPVPPDVHHVTSYSLADLAVTTADYDRVGTEVGTFSTDANLEQQTFTFDVTAFTVAAAGGTLGFRVQLDVDPATNDVGTLGSAFDVRLEATGVPIAVEFDLTPEVLNRSSRGRWVTGRLEPAAPFAAGDIDVASIRLNATVPVDPAATTALGDHDGDGVADLMVKFSRAALELIVADGDDVSVIVTGSLDGQPFAGTDHIRVRHSGQPALAIRALTPSSADNGRLQVELTLRGETPARVELVDVTGRALISRQIGNPGPGPQVLDLSNGRALAPGIYFLRLTQDGHEVRARAAVLR